MKIFVFLQTFILYNLVVKNFSARILAMFSTPSISHQLVFRPLTQELVKHGHKVVVITADPAFPKGKAPENLTEIDVHDIAYLTWYESLLSKIDVNELNTQIKLLALALSTVFDKVMQSDDVKRLVHDKEQSFDLVLTETYRADLILSDVFKAPIIQVSSFGAPYFNYHITGAPTHFTLCPSMFCRRMHNLTIWEKLRVVYDMLLACIGFALHEKYENEILLRTFGPDIPNMSELQNNVHMLFQNVHPIWNGIRPVPPSIIFMNGLHLKPQKDLPKDLKSYLESSVKGVIYISFGTNVKPSNFPSEKIQILVKVLSQLSYDVLWKWDDEKLPGRSRNIKISKWFPQSDVLRHRNIKLFITQGGLQSTDEAITAGVPLIGIPMFTDQFCNVDKYSYHKIGIGLDLTSLTEEKFTTAINTVISDESFRRNILKLRELMNDQPIQPLQRAIWWIEHVLRHGGAKHLRAPAANMSWSEYFVLDIFIPLTMILIAIVILLIALTYRVLSVIFKFLKIS